MRRTTAFVLAASMVALGALPGLARESSTQDRSVGDVVDVIEPTVDRAEYTEVDRQRVRDRETDRYWCVDVVTDRRCIDDRHPHVNVRHLIHRLIQAGEWEKLFRLLHRLGIV
jgi:hypothetical protein